MRQLEDLNEPELQALLNTMGGAIELAAYTVGIERPQFALIVFGDDGIGQYVSNCERAAMVRAIRETADRIESRQETPRVPFPAEGR